MDPLPTSTTNRMAALSVSGNGPTNSEKVAIAPVAIDVKCTDSSFDGYPGTTPSLPAVVPMKFYANWEVDRASSDAKQRVLLLGINRFVVLKPEKIDSSFVIAVRLQRYKRTLRSNDISMAPGTTELSLDISFTLQYSHYFKRKSNTLQVLIQRRKRYKNRPIPGFKTLALGYLNLDDVLQLGGIREIRVWDTAILNKNEADLNELNAGTIFVSNCVSQGASDPAPTSSKVTTNNGIPVSEEEDDDSTEESDFDDHFGEPSSSNQYSNRGGMKARLRNQRKKLNQRNIKSKLTALLKRFKAQGNDADPTCSGTLPPPTEEELEKIFEELENISDSGPELEPDNMSIISNPKPGLRPFFGSKSDILPAIKDDGQRYETSPGESDITVSDNENAHPSLYYANHGFSTSVDSAKQSKTPLTTNFDNRTQSAKVTPSGTTNSFSSISVSGDMRYLSTNQGGIGAGGKKISDVSVIIEMINYFEDPNSFIASNVWLCSSADIPWLTNVDAGQFISVKLIDCPTATEVRAALQAVVARIQKFCNSNSVPPPQTVIGLLGSDKLIVNVLRFYVELLQNRTHQDWLNYLRFTLIIPPTSVFGRTLTTLGDSGFAESQWRLLNRIQPNETTALENCLLSAGPQESSSSKALNIPIGEVMLQLDATALGNGQTESEHIGTTIGSDGQVFIPFIAEIHLGNLEELNSLHYMEDKPSIRSAQSAPAVNGINVNLSPPTSPRVTKLNEWKELQIEYWTAASAINNDFITSGGYHHSPAALSNTTPKNSNGGKFSMKTAVRTLSVAREPLSTLLSMIFVKERKKDKMLQKFSRKAKPRSADSFNSQSRVVSSVSRMICSGKHSPLEVSIDGATWSKVRFFQITSQWQTHVKFFPISVPVPSKSRGD